MGSNKKGRLGRILFSRYARPDPDLGKAEVWGNPQKEGLAGALASESNTR